MKTIIDCWFLLYPNSFRGGPKKHEAEAIRAIQADARADLEQRIKELELALTILYDETADYIKINNLGDIHHNASMQNARKALHL